MILNFHGIGEPRQAARSLGQGEADYWISVDTFRVIMDRIAEAISSGQSVGITFDDGNRSDIEVGLPVLLERGLTASFFVLAGRLGSPGSLDSEEVQTLAAAGMTIGSHGHDHVDWRRLDHAGTVAEFMTARQRLEAIVGAPVDQAAIPFGAYDRRVLTALRRHGYRCVFTSDGGRAGAGWLRARTTVRRDMKVATIDRILSGRESVGHRGRRKLGQLKKRFF